MPSPVITAAALRGLLELCTVFSEPRGSSHVPDALAGWGGHLVHGRGRPGPIAQAQRGAVLGPVCSLPHHGQQLNSVHYSAGSSWETALLAELDVDFPHVNAN